MRITRPSFKVGDRLVYTGPPPTIYTGPYDHPSAYRDYQIMEIKTKNDWLHPHSLFARTVCFDRQHGDRCGGWRHIIASEWTLAPAGTPNHQHSFLMDIYDTSPKVAKTFVDSLLYRCPQAVWRFTLRDLCKITEAFIRKHKLQGDLLRRQLKATRKP